MDLCVVQFPCYQKCLVMFLFMTGGNGEVGNVRRSWLCCFIVFHAHHSCIQLWLCQSMCVDELYHDSLATKNSVRGCAHEMNKTSYSRWRGGRESIMVARKVSKKIHGTWPKKPKLQNLFHPKAIVKEIYCAFDVVGCMLISEALIYTSDNTLRRVPHL